MFTYVVMKSKMAISEKRSSTVQEHFDRAFSAAITKGRTNQRNGWKAPLERRRSCCPRCVCTCHSHAPYVYFSLTACCSLLSAFLLRVRRPLAPSSARPSARWSRSGRSQSSVRSLFTTAALRVHAGQHVQVTDVYMRMNATTKKAPSCQSSPPRSDRLVSARYVRAF